MGAMFVCSCAHESKRQTPAAKQRMQVSNPTFLSHEYGMFGKRSEQKDKTPLFNQVHTQCFVCIDSCFLFPTHLSFLAQLHVSTILPSCKKNTRLSMSFQCSHMGISHRVVCVSAASHLPTCLDQYLLWTYTNHEIHDCACTLTLRCSMGRLPGSWSSLAFSSILFSELTVGAAGTLLGTAPYWWPPGNVEYVVCGWVGWSSALLLKKPWGVFFIWSEDISTAC